nr:MAG TPA: hypothetical protein [Caudoviricetes sp.]
MKGVQERCKKNTSTIILLFPYLRSIIGQLLS